MKKELIKYNVGGVSTNSYLRTRLLELKHKFNKEVYIPKFEYCTDNICNDCY